MFSFHLFSHFMEARLEVQKSTHIRYLKLVQFSCSVVFDSLWPQSLLKHMSIELVMPTNHLILCRPLLLPPSIFPSIRVFSNESALHIRWPKYWSFSFSISPSNGHLGWFSLGLTYSISLQSKGLLLLRTTSDISKVLSLSPVYPFPRRKWQ